MGWGSSKAPSQTIATFQRNISQHLGATCCVRLTAMLRPVSMCCDMLGVGWLKFENDQIFDATFVDVASHADVLRHVTEERVTSLRTSA